MINKVQFLQKIEFGLGRSPKPIWNWPNRDADFGRNWAPKVVGERLQFTSGAATLSVPMANCIIEELSDETDDKPVKKKAA